MAAYRVPEFTQEQRTEAVVQMLSPDRKWGLVSELADLYGVSRSLLYELRDRALDALGEALLPGDAGRPAQVTALQVARASSIGPSLSWPC